MVDYVKTSIVPIVIFTIICAAGWYVAMSDPNIIAAPLAAGCVMGILSACVWGGIMYRR